MLSLGLMSGTSMDGIDAALIETDGKNSVRELGHLFLSYTPEMKILLKAAEFAVRRARGDMLIAATHYPQVLLDYLQDRLGLPEPQLSEILKNLITITFAEVIQRSTELHAKAVHQLLQKTSYTPKQIDVIGYHGQTLYHSPAQKITIQVGDGKLLAELTGITTVNDFRSQDVAMGGQGAPFAPLYHQALAIRDNKHPMAVINCGGIANISFITGANSDEVFGFDTGPGNGLIDVCVKQRTQGKEHMDTHGQYGKQGKVHAAIFDLLYQHAITVEKFFLTPPPKSLDIGDLHLIPELQSLSLADACRTLEAFTADTIVNSINFFNGEIPEYWILAGGGWNNPVIHHELITRIQHKTTAKTQVLTAEAAGWNGQSLEAELIAYLAVRSVYQLPISLPNITSVPTPLMGGVTHISSLGPTAAVAKLLS